MADPREIGLPEGEVSGAGKMLLRGVQLLAIAEHRLICLNLSEAARTLPCDLDIAAMDGAKPPCRKRIRRGFEPAAVGEIGRASCRERGCQSVSISGVAVSLKKQE